MPANIEIKARATDPHRQAAAAQALSGAVPETIHQEDTFFHVPHCRLKLREFADGRAELIYYARPDEAGPTRSQYIVLPTHDAERLKAALSAGLGVRGVVRTQRRLYVVGQTRIHIDQVEGLGTFIELEVVLTTRQSTERGVEIARGLMEKLGIRQRDLIREAYIDLLAPLPPQTPDPL